jgi:hypothetical protein
MMRTFGPLSFYGCELRKRAKQIPFGNNRQERQGQRQRQTRVLRLRFLHPSDEELSLGTPKRFAQDDGFCWGAGNGYGWLSCRWFPRFEMVFHVPHASLCGRTII